jgi:SAM-dependent methyltransferase
VLLDPDQSAVATPEDGPDPFDALTDEGLSRFWDEETLTLHDGWQAVMETLTAERVMDWAHTAMTTRRNMWPECRSLLADLPRVGDAPWIFGFPSERHFRLGERVFGYRPLQILEELGGDIPDVAPGSRIETGDSCGDWAEAVWEACDVLGVRRSAAFLNWRYYSRPHRYYRFYRLASGSREGLAVFAFVGEEAWAAELWLPSGGEWYAPMLAVAAEKSQAISFIEGDAMNLSFADNSFDAVTIAFGLRNLSNFGDGLGELHRILKPGGKLAVLEFSSPVIPGFRQAFNFYFTRVLPRIGGAVSGSRGAYEYLPDSVSKFPDQKRLASLMQETGFDNVEYTNLTGGIAAIHSGIRR